MAEEIKVEETVQEEKSLMEDLGLEEKTEEVKEAEEETKKTEEKETEETEEKEETKEAEETEEKEEKVEETEVKEEKAEKEEITEETDLSEEDIKKLPKDAKGLYYAMKKEREARKNIEAELQYLKLQNKYNKPKEETKIKDEDIENAEDILKDKSDDDIVSVGDVKKILNSQQKKIEKEKQAITSKQKEHQEKIERMDEMEDVFKEIHPDYPEMLKIFGKAAAEIPSLRYEIIAETNRENGNPAKKAYELGKKFKAMYETKSENGKTHENNAARILKNAEKKKPSASVTGQNISKEALEEMEIGELQKTLSSMPMSQFIKVPKKIREKALIG